MKFFLAGCAAVVGLTLATGANAATWTFAAYADGTDFDTTGGVAGNLLGNPGEQAWDTVVGGPGVGILVDGISVIGSGIVTSDASNAATITDAFAYFDSGSAGLGVCGNNGNCVPGNDDNTGAGGGHPGLTGPSFETLTLTFSEIVNLTQVIFAGEGHNNFNGSVVVADDSGTFTRDINALATHNGGNSTWMTSLTGQIISFTYIPIGTGSTINEFYIDSITGLAVPIPAALPLFGTGLVMLGFFGRKRRRANAVTQL